VKGFSNILLCKVVISVHSNVFRPLSLPRSERATGMMAAQESKVSRYFMVNQKVFAFYSFQKVRLLFLRCEIMSDNNTPTDLLLSKMF